MGVKKASRQAFFEGLKKKVKGSLADLLQLFFTLYSTPFIHWPEGSLQLENINLPRGHSNSESCKERNRICKLDTCSTII